MVLSNIKCSLQNNCGLNNTQINLTLVSLFGIVIQGVGFYFIEKDKMNMKLFVFLILVGLVYNVIYFKIYAN